MTLVEAIHNLAWLGAAAGIVILTLGLGALLGVFRNADDGYRPVGEPAPPPPRTSPFAPSPCGDGESSRGRAAGEAKP